MLPTHLQHLFRSGPRVLHDNEHVPEWLTSELEQLRLAFAVNEQRAPSLLKQFNPRDSTEKSPRLSLAEHATQCPASVPLKRESVHTWFRSFRNETRFNKPVTAQMLRHTVATTLLFNGCPIGHIKDILGHDRLMTTCNFYLGADKRAAKKAHGDFLDYERGE